MATAMDSTTSRARIMARAWALFRKKYNYPSTPFRSIGRRCFTYCLTLAWAEAKETARLAALGADRLKRLIVEESTPKSRAGIVTQFWEDATLMVARYARIERYTAALNLAEAI